MHSPNIASKDKLLIIFIIWIGILSLFVSAASSFARIDESVVPLDRELEPVLIKGVFAGASVDDVFVYREVGGSWQQIPFQIDEVTSAGEYASSENLVMDANDEVVIMIEDLGDKATTSITETLPVDLIWYEIEVTDPLNPSAKGWAYIVRSSVLNRTNNTDYVNYNGGNQRVVAENYTLGWATDFSGLNYLSLFGSNNLIDRSKIRVNYQFLGSQETLTEEDFTAPENILVKDGRIRVIVRRGTANVLAYGSLQHTNTPIDLTGLPGSITIDSARFSLDMASNVPEATFFNENVPGGVPIDGSPDVVPTTPVNKSWFQVSTNAGTFIQITSASGMDGALSYYYNDDDANDPADTGDGRSFGDSGLSITNLTTRYFVIESFQYYLSGKQNNRGNEFFGKSNNPPLVKVTLMAPHAIFLPLVTTSN